MRLEWIEDILAVLKTGSFKQAAEQRCLSQSAFSRRIKTIEDYVGVSLIDRTRKPAQLNVTLHDEQARLEQLAAEMRNLLYELRQRERRARRRVVVVGQHATIVAVAPALIRKMVSDVEVEIELRSANRAECFFALATNQADLALVYRFQNEELPLKGYLIDEANLWEERIIPVFTTKGGEYWRSTHKEMEVAVVTYPADVFFGQVLSKEIFPMLPPGIYLRRKAETALTLAALQLALEGVGVAWVPESLAAKELTRGGLGDLSGTLIQSKLLLAAVRIHGRQSSAISDVWEVITQRSGSTGSAKRRQRGNRATD